MGDTSNRIPWKRVGVEAFAIVGSILLAFAIDASWNDRLRDGDELLLLESIKADMQSNRAEIERVAEINGHGIRSYFAFIESSSAELSELEADSAVSLLDGLRQTATFTPYDGSLRGIDRSLLSSHEVRRTLGAWEGLSADLVEHANPLLEGTRAVWEATAGVSPEVLLRRSIEGSPSAALAALRGDPDFIVAMATHDRFLRVGRAKLGRLREKTDSLLVLLEEGR